jgi:hypothetical protein
LYGIVMRLRIGCSRPLSHYKGGENFDTEEDVID